MIERRTLRCQAGEPIEMSIGDFRLYDEPELLYLNIHPVPVLRSLLPKKGRMVTLETLAAGKLGGGRQGNRRRRQLMVAVERQASQKTILSVLWDGSSEDITEVRSTNSADGSLGVSKLHLTIRYGTIWDSIWDWTPGDSLDLTLILNPQTYALRWIHLGVAQGPGRKSRRVSYLQRSGDQRPPRSRCS